MVSAIYNNRSRSIIQLTKHWYFGKFTNMSGKNDTLGNVQDIGETQQNTELKEKRLRNLTNAGKGRPKGVKNKVTRSLKEQLVSAYEKLGGEQALVAWADSNERNRAKFYELVLTKLIPKEMTLDATIDQKIDLADRLIAARNNAQLADGVKPKHELSYQGKTLPKITNHDIQDRDHIETSKERVDYITENNTNGYPFGNQSISYSTSVTTFSQGQETAKDCSVSNATLAGTMSSTVINQALSDEIED